ncbi:CPBP family intramembrane metalloprotease [Candidatus Saccharibacteria bacterium]|nr:CPBP family intramembrane metalloprotease [Candidatus Saccharibacteria bacterium]
MGSKAKGATTKKIRSQSKITKRLILEALALVLWVVAVFYGVQWLVGIILGLIINASGGTAEVGVATSTLVSAIIYLISCLIIILVPKLILKGRGGTSRDELGLRGLPTWTDIGLAPIGYIVSSIVGALLLALCSIVFSGLNIDWNQSQDLGGFELASTVGEKWLAFVALVVIAPIAEEVIFRGWLYGKLRARMSALPAILIVSILFGVVHGQWNVGILVAIMSVAMCLIRELTGTIWSGILVHMIRNGIAFYLLFSAAYGGLGGEAAGWLL